MTDPMASMKRFLMTIKGTAASLKSSRMPGAESGSSAAGVAHASWLRLIAETSGS